MCRVYLQYSTIYLWYTLGFIHVQVERLKCVLYLIPALLCFTTCGWPLKMYTRLFPESDEQSVKSSITSRVRQAHNRSPFMSLFHFPSLTLSLSLHLSRLSFSFNWDQLERRAWDTRKWLNFPPWRTITVSKQKKYFHNRAAKWIGLSWGLSGNNWLSAVRLRFLLQVQKRWGDKFHVS